MFLPGLPKMIMAGGGQDDHFPRVFPKMIMVRVVGLRKTSSWPRILLGLHEDDHGVGGAERRRDKASPWLSDFVRPVPWAERSNKRASVFR